MQLMRLRTKTRLIGALTLTAVMGLSGVLAAESLARSASGTSATLSLRKTTLGMILVNSRGHTLYLFAKDRNGKSACSATCASYWPPLLSRGKPTLGSGVKAALIGTTKRSNGSLQITYNKHPLYSYLLDKAAGQTNGEGSLAFGGRWYSVSARGTAVVKASTTTTTHTTTATTTGGCAYPPCP